MSTDSLTIELDIVADDLGYCQERNRSIGECFSKGVVTRATLLVNFAASEGACQLAAALGLPLGLHLNLTEGRPLTGESNTLLDPLHPSEMRGKIGFREAWRLGVISAADVRAEVTAQVERFKALTGSYPRWVDGHQHVHVLPEVAEWIMEALMGYRAAIKSYRLPLVRSKAEREALSPFLQEVSQQAALLEDRVLERFPESNRIFVGASTMGRLSSREAACSTLVRERAALLQLQAGKCSSVVRAEWMVHPGHPSQELHADDFARSDERLHEHLLLLDSHNQLRRSLLNEVGVVLPPR